MYNTNGQLLQNEPKLTILELNSSKKILDLKKSNKRSPRFNRQNTIP